VLIVSLVLVAALGENMALAPGQEALWAAHADGFPKAAWVVGEDLPVSSSPRLTGRLVKVLPVGSFVQVAGVVEPALVARPDSPPRLEEILALPLSQGQSRPGYVRAEGLAVFETLLGHPGGGVKVFASVVGQELHAEKGGLVLSVAVWCQRGEEAPTGVMVGLNVAPGLTAWESTSGGMAVGLGGEVVVLDREGATLWRSPQGESWALLGRDGDDFLLRGPDGEPRRVGRPEPE
jgi:hypothetical protein